MSVCTLAHASHGVMWMSWSPSRERQRETQRQTETGERGGSFSTSKLPCLQFRTQEAAVRRWRQGSEQPGLQRETPPPNKQKKYASLFVPTPSDWLQAQGTHCVCSLMLMLASQIFYCQAGCHSVGLDGLELRDTASSEPRLKACPPH